MVKSKPVAIILIIIVITLLVLFILAVIKGKIKGIYSLIFVALLYVFYLIIKKLS